MTVIRAAGLADVDDYRRLQAAVFPYQVTTAAGVAYRWRRDDADPRARHGLFAAEAGGRVVGFARCFLSTSTSERGAAAVEVMVDPAARRRGIGAALLEAAHGHLAAAGAAAVRGWGDDSEAARRFGEAHGYRRVDQSRASARDLTAPLPDAPPPPGAQVLPWTACDPAELYPVDRDTMVDEPGDQSFDNVSWEDWRVDVWERPAFSRELSRAVRVDGRVVAVTLLDADPQAGTVISVGTGTLRPFRGRGLATVAKVAALRAAAAAGFRAAYTGNDETNAAMLAVNTRLGYRPVATEWLFRRTLTPTP